MNSGGDKSLLFSFREASPEEIRSRCGSCHESESDAAHTHRTATCLGATPPITTEKKFYWWRPLPSYVPIATTGADSLAFGGRDEFQISFRLPDTLRQRLAGIEGKPGLGERFKLCLDPDV